MNLALLVSERNVFEKLRVFQDHWRQEIRKHLLVNPCDQLTIDAVGIDCVIAVTEEDNRC